MKSIFLRLIPPFTLFISLPLFATAGFSQIGYGIRAKGMGGVATALPHDAMIIATNPAGLICVDDRLDANLYIVRPDNLLKIESQEQPNDLIRHTSHEYLVFPEIALSHQLCGNQAGGVAIFTFGGFNTLYHPSPEGVYGTTAPGMEYKQVIFSPAWAWRIHPRHSLGIAVNVAFTWLSAKGLENLEASSESPPYTTNRGTDHEEGLSVRLGWLYRITPCLHLGLAYQTPTWVNRFRKYKGFLSDRGDFVLPSQWTGGVAYWWHRCFVTALDVEYLHWRDARFLRNDSRSTAGLIPAGEPLYGSPKGPGLGWKDQVLIKAGGSWKISRCITLRAGYTYGRPPFNGKSLTLNALINTPARHHITGGATWIFGCNEISGVVIFGLAERVPGTITPFSADTTTRPGELRGRQDSFGVGYTRRF